MEEGERKHAKATQNIPKSSNTSQKPNFQSNTEPFVQNIIQWVWNDVGKRSDWETGKDNPIIIADIAYAPEGDGTIFFSKTDMKDGFWRILCQAKKE